MRYFYAFLVLFVPFAVPATLTAGAPHRVELGCKDDPHLDRELKAIQIFLEEHTGLHFARPVPIRRLPPDEFRRNQAKAYEENLPARAKEWKVLRALNLINVERNAENTFRELLLASVTGYYSFGRREIVLPTGQLGELTVLAHELHHGLIAGNYHLQQLLDEAKNDPDLDMTLRAVIEGAAVLAEKTFEDWKETKQAIPSRKLLAKIQAQARAELWRTYGRQAGSLDRATIEADAMFAYQWGLLWVATQALENHDRFHEWYRGLFVAERLPRSTRHVLHGRGRDDDAAEPFPLDLAGAAKPFLAVQPDYRIVEVGTLGELFVRLWLRRTLTADLAQERSPLGLAADRFCVLEQPENRVLVGAVVLLFDSESQARNLLTSQRASTSLLHPRTLRQGRTMIVPLGQCPDPLLDRVIDAVKMMRLPPRAPHADALRADLDHFLYTRDSLVWTGLVQQFDQCRHRQAFVRRLAIDLFDRIDANAWQEEGRWQAYDDLHLDLGKRATAALPALLTGDERTFLRRAALAALAGDESLPIGRLNALRWVLARPDDLSAQEWTTIRAAVRRHFPHEAELGKWIDGLAKAAARPLHRNPLPDIGVQPDEFSRHPIRRPKK